MTCSIVPKWSADYTELVGWNFDRFAVMDESDANAALVLILSLESPADPDDLAKEMHRCWVMTKSRPEDAQDFRLAIASIADELSHLPSDAVLSTLREWPRKNVFRPALRELLDIIDRKTRMRSMYRRAIETKFPKWATR